MRRRDRAVGKHPRFVELAESDLGQLNALVGYLNAAQPEGRPRGPLERRLVGPILAEARQQAEAVIELVQAKAPARSIVESYYKMAAESPLLLGGAVVDGRLVPAIRAARGAESVEDPETERDRVARLVALLFQALFVLKPSLNRLKRCGRCRRWYVDRTLGNRKRACSELCARDVKRERDRITARRRRGRQ